MWALVRATAFAIAIISSSLSAQTARSATYNIDLNTATGVSGTGGGAGWVEPCYCYSTITYSPIFLVHPGTVDFGSIETFGFESGPTPDAARAVIHPH
jgi:hypothetical protein